MLKQQLLEDLKKAIGKMDYPATDIVLSIPENEAFGDYSTNIALQLSKLKSGNAKHSPAEIAKEILSHLGHPSYLSKAEVAGPGFLNIFIKPEVLAGQIGEVLKQGDKFGGSDTGYGKKARVEYVSANPTGPLHFGNARGGPIGDVLSNVLRFCGWEVLREYLDNDRGNQVLELGKTLSARAGLINVPEEGLTYKGEYTKELADKIKPQLRAGLNEGETITGAGELGVKILFEEIIRDCKDLGIEFDHIVHESKLQKQAPDILKQLEEKGVLKKEDGALWFAPKSEFLKDREAVVVKSDGSYTYFAADIVYHREKLESGYDLVVDVFGSNTSGHVPKLKALAEVLGFDPNKIQVILYQFVRVKRGEEVVKMSKRAGNFVTAREVLSEVGKDAFRFFILMHDPNTHMDFDLELAKEQSNKNPVYYVQYAHARMSNILKKAEGKAEGHPLQGQAFLLGDKTELALIKHLVQFPDLVEEIAQDYQVHKLTFYSTKLADLFHKFYESCRVLNAESKELQEARLALVRAAKIVLGNILGLLGIEAPERM